MSPQLFFSWRILQHARIAAIHDIDIPFLIHRDTGSEIQLPFGMPAVPPGAQERPVAVEFLNPVVPAVHSIDIAKRVARDAPRRLKLARPAAFFPPFDEEAAARIELLDTIVRFIRHKDIAHEIHRDAAWEEKGTVIAAVLAPLHEWGSIGLEFLDTGVARIGHVQVSLVIGRHAPGHVELPDLGATIGKPKLSPGMHAIAFGIELLNPVIAAVRHIDRTVRPGGKTSRVVKLPFLRARLAAPSSDELAVLIELLNRMVVRISDVNISVVVQCDTGRRAQFPIVHPGLPYGHHHQIRRRNCHHLRRLGAFSLRRNHRHDVVVAEAVRQVVVHKGRRGPLNEVPFLFGHPDDWLEVLFACERTRDIGLDEDTFGGLEVEVVVHRVRDRIPRNRDL